MVRWEAVMLMEWVREETVHLGSGGRRTVQGMEFDTAELEFFHKKSAVISSPQGGISKDFVL